jgi:hypothetical protein
MERVYQTQPGVVAHSEVSYAVGTLVSLQVGEFGVLLQSLWAA